MTGLTDLGFFRNDNSTAGWQAGLKNYQPVEKTSKTTNGQEHKSSRLTGQTSIQRTKITFESPVPAIWAPIMADTVPLQIWEGTVLSVDPDEGIISTQLVAKIGEVARHTADISFEWISEQDKELVQPGAIFYLTLYKRTKLAGSIENSQELRFRRRPSWSSMELKRIDKRASTLLAKMTSLPIADD